MACLAANETEPPPVVRGAPTPPPAPPAGAESMTTPADTPAPYDREPTADERAGMVWWNALSEAERLRWMHAAGDTGIAADAWTAYQRAQGRAATH